MPVSVPRKNSVPFSRFGFTLFYLKTWTCPTGYFFNITSDLCETCAIPNCGTCVNANLCSACSTGFTLFPNALPASQCTSCPITGCITCSTSTSCGTCDTAANYILVSSGKAGNTNKCTLCTIPNCLNCSSLTVCATCDTPNNFFLSSVDDCIPCDIMYCLKCSSLTNCTTCD